MKAKFKLGFMTGFKHVDDAWPGQRRLEYLLEPDLVSVSDIRGVIECEDPRQVKALVFECKEIDDDKAAVFEFLEIR